MEKIIVAMSGGVDSSVAAYLLKEQGYEVEGVTYYMYEHESSSGKTTCTSLKSVREVASVADYLDIKHEIIDIRKEFSRIVIEPFVNSYQKGMTPNPCIICNRYIKFPMLLERAKQRNASYISTGHYAIVDREPQKNIASLKKGVDPKKDQSYFLYALNQEILNKLILPLGSMTKKQIKEIALKIDLQSVKKEESQEICFIQGSNYKEFVKAHPSYVSKPGPIIHINGEKIGEHKGIYNYTVGQRKGLGVAFHQPLYIVKIDPATNTIFVGTREYAEKREFFVSEVNWIQERFKTSETFIKAFVKIRSTMKEKPARIYLYANGRDDKQILRIVFDEPQWAPAPGQSAVFYDKDIVIGGGIIL